MQEPIPFPRVMAYMIDYQITGQISSCGMADGNEDTKLLPPSPTELPAPSRRLNDSSMLSCSN